MEETINQKKEEKSSNKKTLYLKIKAIKAQLKSMQDEMTVQQQKIYEKFVDEKKKAYDIHNEKKKPIISELRKLKNILDAEYKKPDAARKVRETIAAINKG